MTLPKRPKEDLFKASKRHENIDASLIDKAVNESTRNRVTRPVKPEDSEPSIINAGYLSNSLPIKPIQGWVPATLTPQPGLKFIGFQSVLTPSEYSGISVVPFNPRKYESVTDVSAFFDEELYESIKGIGQNSKPAVARFVDGKIEIIEGSRRLYNAKKANANFFIQVFFDISDEQAEFLSYVENLGRGAIGVLAFSKFLLQSYERAIAKNPTTQIKEFAATWGIAADNATRCFNFARLPSFILDAASYKKDDLWTWRKATEMRQLYEAITLEDKGWSSNFISETELQTIIETAKSNPETKDSFISPTRFNKFLKSLALKINGDKPMVTNSNEVINVKEGGVECLAVRSRSGLQVKLNVSLKKAEQFTKELSRLIDKYTV